MYTTSVRPLQDFGLATYGGGSSVSVQSGEYTYSWRTGRKAGNLTDFINTRAPSGSGNVAERLKERRDFMNQLDSNMSSVSTGKPSDFRCLAADTGHAFVSVKYAGRPHRVVSSYPGTPDRVRLGFPWFAASPEWGVGKTQPHFETTNVWGVTGGINPQYHYFPSVPTATFNRLFKQTAPDSLGLGEFVVELLRGDLPGLLSSLRKAASSVSSRAKVVKLNRSTSPGFFDDVKNIFLRGGQKPKWLKSVGSDYLEFQFGMMPYVTLFLSIVKALDQISGALYSDSFRRERTGGFTSDSVTNVAKPYRPDWDIAAPINAGPLSGASFSGSGGFPAYTESYNYSMDHRLSLRATKAGRPTSGLRSIMDRSDDEFTKLGLWYPSLGWDLLPYSWLIDYFAHIGSAIENVAAYSESGVSPLDYAYMTTKVSHYMQRDLSTTRWTDMNGSTHRFNGPAGFASTKTLIRKPVTPFGFTLSGLENLSQSQYAILVALGLAKR